MDLSVKIHSGSIVDFHILSIDFEGEHFLINFSFRSLESECFATLSSDFGVLKDGTGL